MSLIGFMRAGTVAGLGALIAVIHADAADLNSAGSLKDAPVAVAIPF